MKKKSLALARNTQGKNEEKSLFDNKEHFLSWHHIIIPIIGWYKKGVFFPVGDFFLLKGTQKGFKQSFQLPRDCFFVTSHFAGVILVNGVPMNMNTPRHTSSYPVHHAAWIFTRICSNLESRLLICII